MPRRPAHGGRRSRIRVGRASSGGRRRSLTRRSEGCTRRGYQREPCAAAAGPAAHCRRSPPQRRRGGDRRPKNAARSRGDVEPGEALQVQHGASMSGSAAGGAAAALQGGRRAEVEDPLRRISASALAPRLHLDPSSRHRSTATTADADQRAPLHVGAAANVTTTVGRATANCRETRHTSRNGGRGTTAASRR